MGSERIVLDTNCLIASLSKHSKTHNVWANLLNGSYTLCVSTEIIKEYEEIVARKTNEVIARHVVDALISCNFVEVHEPYFRFHLIEQDNDDNKFVDCAIAANARLIVSQDVHFKVLSKIPFPKVEVIDVFTFSEYLRTRK